MKQKPKEKKMCNCPRTKEPPTKGQASSAFRSENTYGPQIYKDVILYSKPGGGTAWTQDSVSVVACAVIRKPTANLHSPRDGGGAPPAAGSLSVKQSGDLHVAGICLCSLGHANLGCPAYLQGEG